MKACVYDQYGDPGAVLHIEDVAEPVPAADQVRVKVRVTSVNAPDWRMVRADPFLVRASSGLWRPGIRTLGSDVAGTVDAVGSSVTGLQVGDEVFADLAEFGFGGFAEKVCAAERAWAKKPVGLSFDDAAATPMAGRTALQGLRDRAKVQPGQRVLIVGASGGVGTFAVQLARLLGAEVTAVCSSSKVELVRSLGATRVIDYTREDFAATGEQWDVVFAVNGFRPIRDFRRALTPDGTYLMAGGQWPQIRQALLWGPILSLLGSQRLGALTIVPSPDDLAQLAEMIVSGQLKPVIDRRFPLAEVADAVRYVGEGHARGKVLVDVAPI
jgi:NADPH:quinone reductase-like Zn-dependent oxidoreductase